MFAPPKSSYKVAVCGYRNVVPNSNLRLLFGKLLIGKKIEQTADSTSTCCLVKFGGDLSCLFKIAIGVCELKSASFIGTGDHWRV